MAARRVLRKVKVILWNTKCRSLNNRHGKRRDRNMWRLIVAYLRRNNIRVQNRTGTKRCHYWSRRLAPSEWPSSSNHRTHSWMDLKLVINHNFVVSLVDHIEGLSKFFERHVSDKSPSSGYISVQLIRIKT